MGPVRGPLVYAIVSDLQSWLKLSLDAVLAIGCCLQDRHTQAHTDTLYNTQACGQTIRQTDMMTKVGAGRFTLKFLARHERAKSMTRAGQMHAHL